MVSIKECVLIVFAFKSIYCIYYNGPGSLTCYRSSPDERVGWICRLGIRKPDGKMSITSCYLPVISPRKKSKKRPVANADIYCRDEDTRDPVEVPKGLTKFMEPENNLVFNLEIEKSWGA